MIKITNKHIKNPKKNTRVLEVIEIKHQSKKVKSKYN